MNVHNSSQSKDQEYTTDFLIIGSGMAGLFAALTLVKWGRITLLTKLSLTHSNSYYAQGGMAAAVSYPDSPLAHREDTLAAGAGLCDRAAVNVLVREGPARVRDLLTLGIPFDRTANEISLTREAAHSQRRILHAHGDCTGRVISEHLAARVRDDPRIDIWENTPAVKLLVADNRCRGAVALVHGKPVSFRAIATILATGGAGQLYSETTNPEAATGDGLALAYRAGAALMDLEFVQFHPTVLIGPRSGRRFLLTEALRGEGAVLRNQQEERFMPRYHQLADLAPRDVVARAIVAEMKKTGSSCVYLDARGLGSDMLQKRFPQVYAACRQEGLDMAKDLLPVAPAAHYTMGGVFTGLYGETTLPGLFACGEVACTGVHGANRLASNSLLETIVFGYRAANAARAFADDPRLWEPAAIGFQPEATLAHPSYRDNWEEVSGAESQQLLENTGHSHGAGPSESAIVNKNQPLPKDLTNHHLAEKLAKIMWQEVGIIRSAPSLRRALNQVEFLQHRWEQNRSTRLPGRSVNQSTFPQDLQPPVLPDETAVPADPELSGRFLISRLMITAALCRKESRGAHYRADFPAARPEWRKHIAISRRDGLTLLPLREKEG